MEEERIELAELETTESEDVQEDAKEIVLEPEDRARQLFASYLEPSRDEPAPDGDQEKELPPADELEQIFIADEVSQSEVSEEDASEDLVSQDEASRDEVSEPEPDEEGSEAVASIGEAGEGRRNWFVIHSYSGYENKVKKNLEHRIESLDMQNKIFEVVVPTEEEIELKDGQRRTVERRIFPGYILVDMLMDEDSWYVVRNTPGVTGFVGSIRKPTPLRQRDVDRILKRMRAETPRVTVTFLPGQKVRIADGPFEDFVGTVDDIYPDKGKVRILVSFFGRETPVELDFLQVGKI